MGGLEIGKKEIDLAKLLHERDLAAIERKNLCRGGGEGGDLLSHLGRSSFEKIPATRGIHTRGVTGMVSSSTN